MLPEPQAQAVPPPRPVVARAAAGGLPVDDTRLMQRLRYICDGVDLGVGTPAEAYAEIAALLRGAR